MTKRLKLSPPNSPTSSPAMPPPAPPRFSSLPPEIRTAIYTHLFSLPHIQPPRCRTYHSSPPLTLHRPVFAAPTALFLTSRQIGSEARKVFYADNLLALISIETTALSAPLVWLLKTLPERITWALLPDDKPPPTGCPVVLTYQLGRGAMPPDSDEELGGGGGCHRPSPPSASPPSHHPNKPKSNFIIIATTHFQPLTREWTHSELTLPECRFSIHSLPTAGWTSSRLTEMIFRPLTRLSHVKSIDPLGGPRDRSGVGGIFKPVEIVDRTGVFEGIVFPRSERSRMRERLWKRWGLDLKERAREKAVQRRELAMRRSPVGYSVLGWGWDDEVVTEGLLGVGKMAEGLVREMMGEGSEEDGKLDLGWFLEEVVREKEEGLT